MLKRLAMLGLLAAFGCTTRLSNPPIGAGPTGDPLVPTTLPAGAIRLSAANTRVTFIGTAVMNSHEGTFTQLSGVLRAVDDDPNHATLTATIETASVYTEIGLLTQHLKAADFFDVERYPLATFTSTRIESGPGQRDQHVVTGDFTIHGTTRRLSFPARIAITDQAVDLDATITIRQSDFGMDPTRSTTDDVPVTVTCRLRRH